jgi:hypothetical protein
LSAGAAGLRPLRRLHSPQPPAAVYSPPMRGLPALAIGMLALALPLAAGARTVYECLRDETLSQATAPEPG